MQENNDRKRTGCQSMAMELGRARPRIRLTIVVPSEMHTVRNEGPWHPEIDRITVPTKQTINMDEWPTSPPLTTGPSRDEELTTLTSSRPLLQCPQHHHPTVAHYPSPTTLRTPLYVVRTQPHLFVFFYIVLEKKREGTRSRTLLRPSS